MVDNQNSIKEELRKREEELRKRIDAGSDDPKEYLELARLLRDDDRFEQAVTMFRSALDLPLENMDRAGASIECGWCLCNPLFQIEPAVLLAERAVSLLQDEAETSEVLALRGSAYALLADCLHLQNNCPASNEATTPLEYLERAAAMNPDNDIAQLEYPNAATLHLRLANAEDAISFSDRLLALNLRPDYRVDGLLLRASALQMANRFLEAEQTLKEAKQQTIESNRQLAEWFSELGESQYGQGRLQEALKSFKEAIPHYNLDLPADRLWWLDARIRIAEIKSELREDAAAALEYRQILADMQHEYEYRLRDRVMLGLADCCIQLGAEEEAISLSEQVLASPTALDENRITAKRSLLYADGSRNLESENYGEARAAFLKLLEKYSTEDEFRSSVVLKLGNCYFGLGLFAAARDAYAEVIASEQVTNSDRKLANGALVYTEARLLYSARNYAEARAGFQRFLDHPAAEGTFRISGLLMLGYSHFDLEEYDEAIECFKCVLGSCDASEEDKSTAHKWLSAVPSRPQRWLRRLMRLGERRWG